MYKQSPIFLLQITSNYLGKASDPSKDRTNVAYYKISSTQATRDGKDTKTNKDNYFVLFT